MSLPIRQEVLFFRSLPPQQHEEFFSPPSNENPPFLSVNFTIARGESVEMLGEKHPPPPFFLFLYLERCLRTISPSFRLQLYRGYLDLFNKMPPTFFSPHPPPNH